MPMDDRNVCKFVPTKQVRNEINVINFVYEKQAKYTGLKMTAVSSMHLVTSGTGKLHTPTHSFELKTGDIFLRLPAKQYAIENRDNLNFIYISYEGNRAREFLDRICFNEHAPVYHGFEYLSPFWEESVNTVNENNIDLMAEGVLLYTASCICSRFTFDVPDSGEQNHILRIKQYLDEHYTDPELNLQTLSELFSYHYKYVSKMFARTVGMRFHEYLTNLRLSNAVRLIENGFLSVKEIAHMSGFSDALYFSKVFTRKNGMSPSEMIKKYGKKKAADFDF